MVHPDGVLFNRLRIFFPLPCIYFPINFSNNAIFTHVFIRVISIVAIAVLFNLVPSFVILAN